MRTCEKNNFFGHPLFIAFCFYMHLSEKVCLSVHRSVSVLAGPSVTTDDDDDDFYRIFLPLNPKEKLFHRLGNRSPFSAMILAALTSTPWVWQDRNLCRPLRPVSPSPYRSDTAQVGPCHRINQELAQFVRRVLVKRPMPDQDNPVLLLFWNRKNTRVFGSVRASL